MLTLGRSHAATEDEDWFGYRWCAFVPPLPRPQLVSASPWAEEKQELGNPCTDLEQLKDDNSYSKF